MEASTQQQIPLSTFALGGASGREIALEGAGLTRLALMVGDVFDRLTAVEDRDPGEDRGPSSQPS